MSGHGDFARSFFNKQGDAERRRLFLLHLIFVGDVFVRKQTFSKPKELAFAAVDVLDGDGDGVDLVVVSCVGKRTNFVKKHIQPRAADEDHFSFFGPVRPGQGSCEFVVGDGHQANYTSCQ